MPETTLDVGDIMRRYAAEVAALTQRALIAEAERDMLRSQLASTTTATSDSDTANG